MPKVSIIMPNRNNEKWLSKSIGSILNQTYKNWELIVVDDHSSDKSVNVIKSFMDRDSRIDCICDPDVTYPLTKNLGFEHSSGKYVAFLDSDDWLEREFLERGIRNIKGVDGYASSFAVWFGSDNYRYFKFKSGVFSNIDALKLKFRFRNGNTLLKRSMIERYEIDFPKERRSEDVYFYSLYLAFSERIFVDDYIGLVVNKLGSSVSLSGISGLLETLKVYEKLFKRLDETGKRELGNIIKGNDLLFSMLTYLDSAPRKYKVRYGMKYFPNIVRFLLLSDFYMKDWALATFVDLFIPVKWVLRKAK